MHTSDNRILTTHAGSLVRAPELVEALMVRDLGEPVDDAAYEAALTTGVREVVRRQAELGLDVIDDGEFGKPSWTWYITERLDGIELLENQQTRVGLPDADRFGGFYRAYTQLESTQWLPEAPSRQRYLERRGGAIRSLTHFACTGPLAYRADGLKRDLGNLRVAVDQAGATEAFVPVAAPASVELIQNQHYADQEEFLFAIADVLAVEYRTIVDAGFLLQVDDALLPMRYVLSFRDRPLSDYLAWAELRIEALNRALRDIPADQVRYHVCFGSQNVPHISDIELRDLLDLVLRVDAQAYSLEASNPRHEHEWQVWEETRLPDDKVLIPGVISHATNVVEHPDLIAMRLANFARLVGRERVIAGTDCGFSQFWNTPRVHEEVQWAKLEALGEGARRASAGLW